MASTEPFKKFVERLNPDFTCIPSLGDASKYNLLSILFIYITTTAGYIQNSKKAKLINVGPLQDKTRQAMDVDELIEKAKDENICIYDNPAYSSTKENSKLGGNMKTSKLETSMLASHDQSSHNKESATLGKITKKSLSYEQIQDWLDKLSSFDENFIELARTKNLFIIYEVLHAEKLEVLQSISTKTTSDIGIGNGGKAASDLNENVPQKEILASKFDNSASFSKGKEVQKVQGMSRPKEWERFPIAYKCGEIRLICHKGGKKSFRLANMDKFYKPFDATCTDDHSHIHTCKEQSCKRKLKSSS